MSRKEGKIFFVKFPELINNINFSKYKDVKLSDLNHIKDNSHLYGFWICNCGVKFSRKFSRIVKSKFMCNDCALHKRELNKILKVGSFLDHFPEKAKRADLEKNKQEGLPPLNEILPRSMKKGNWICLCSNSFASTFNDVAKGQWCLPCGRKKTGLKNRNNCLKKNQSFLEKNPDKIKFINMSENINDNLPELSLIPPFSHLRGNWICKKKHKFKLAFSHVSGGKWCGKCAYIEKRKKQIAIRIKSEGSFFENYPEKASQANLKLNKKNGIPSLHKILSKSQKKGNWICKKCNHCFCLTFHDVVNGLWCDKCNPPLRGFDKNKPAQFYILKSSTDNIVKFGISNYALSRTSGLISKNKDFKFKIYFISDYFSGFDIAKVEKEVKKQIPKLKIENLNVYDGYTEMAELSQLKKIIKILTSFKIM